MTTIAAALQEGRALCARAGDTAALDAQLLLCDVLACDRAYLFTWPERQLDAAAYQAYQALLEQRAMGIPIAHLLGQREFWSLSLQVNASTLIPRPETELLVHCMLASGLAGQTARLLELGTGTGAISLALASEQPQWSIVATDINPNAVQLALSNRHRLGLEQPQLLQSDWFAQLAPEQFDAIISNPPYLASDDPHLQQGDVRYEPHRALVAAEQGLADLRQLVSTGRDWLVPGGMLWLEHGAEQGSAVREMMIEHAYQEVRTWRDDGGRDRVTAGQWPGE